jgi:hypothetical protein
MDKTIEQSDKRKARRRRYKLYQKLKRAAEMKVSIRLAGIESAAYNVISNNPHVVIIQKDVPPVCDCGNGAFNCGHVLAVRLYRGEAVSYERQRILERNKGMKPRSKRNKLRSA